MINQLGNVHIGTAISGEKILEIRKSHMNKSTLRERGWTTSQIKQYLGDPDLSFYRGKLNHFYRNERVFQAEQEQGIITE